MTRRLQHWIAAHEAAVILGLLAVAVGLRTLLVLASPTPFGYVWDFYQEGVRVLANEGRLPLAVDCWQCYHPPLLYVLGWPLYELGQWLGQPGDDTIAMRLTAGLSLPAAAVVIYYGYRLLRLFGCRGSSLVTGLAILLICPALFISSYGADADIVTSAFLSAFLFYFARYATRPTRSTVADAMLLGLLLGLAVATKYSGLAGLASAGLFLATRVALGPARGRALRDGIIIFAVCLLVGSWKYVDNFERYGTPMFSNGSAAEGLSFGRREIAGRYEFTTLRLGEVRQLFGFGSPRGDLTGFPVYRSVFTSLHSLLWSDMSFFSVRSRHGQSDNPYPYKQIPVNLVMAVIVLGLVPEALAIIGFTVTLRRRTFRPLAIFCVVTLSAYFWWVIPQDSWALKTKYILCLLPPAVLFAVVGHGWLQRRVPLLGNLATILMLALVVLTHVYLYAFAAGGLG